MESSQIELSIFYRSFSFQKNQPIQAPLPAK